MKEESNGKKESGGASGIDRKRCKYLGEIDIFKTLVHLIIDIGNLFMSCGTILSVQAEKEYELEG